MPTNIEIKAVIRDWERMRRAAESLTDRPLEILEQEDTFFRCATGRLKLRQFSEGHGELIAYQRADLTGTKSSNYSITKTNDPAALRRALAGALGVLGVFKKQRHLYMHGPTRIHLDKVDELGTFVELEVVLKPGQSTAEGDELARDLMEKLEIRSEDLLAGAYLDLLTEKTVLQSP